MARKVSSDPRERFAALLRAEDTDIDLGEIALLIAAEEYPRLDIPGYLRRLDDLARIARPLVAQEKDARAQIVALNDFLFGREGFRGNHDDYYDPANSYLNEVLERRKGIPILLALVYTEVGRRIGLPVHGVGFPGHFLVKYVGASDELLVDPFFGSLMSPENCLERLRTIYGQGARLRPEFFALAEPKEIVARILRNLKHVHVKRKDWKRALACCDRLLLVFPDAAAELRDRALLYKRLDCFTAALADMERFLELVPSGEAADSVRSQIPFLREAVERLH